jgi:hypothetical protein
VVSTVVVIHCCAIPDGVVTVVLTVTPAKYSSWSFATVVVTEGAVVVTVPRLYSPLLASTGVALLTPE